MWSRAKILGGIIVKCSGSEGAKKRRQWDYRNLGGRTNKVWLAKDLWNGDDKGAMQKEGILQIADKGLGNAPVRQS